MYIRSQEKRFIFNAARVGYSPTADGHYIVVDGVVFGKYSTQQQAEEVMEEIYQGLTNDKCVGYDLPADRGIREGEPEVIIDETNQS